jgi:seryl-tRNA synthetase
MHAGQAQMDINRLEAKKLIARRRRLEAEMAKMREEISKIQDELDMLLTEPVSVEEPSAVAPVAAEGNEEAPMCVHNTTHIFKHQLTCRDQWRLCTSRVDFGR